MAGKRAAGWSRRIGVFVGVVSGVIGVGLLGLLAVLFFGHRQGTELCLETLERRRFSYYEVPLLRRQLSGADYHEQDCQLTEGLLSQGFFLEPPPAQKSWRLIYSTLGYGEPPPSDVDILTNYLDARDHQYESPWLEWTKKNLPLARVLWNAVAVLARREQYPYIPELVDLAQGGDPPAQRQQQIEQRVAARLNELAAAETDAQLKISLQAEAQAWAQGKAVDMNQQPPVTKPSEEAEAEPVIDAGAQPLRKPLPKKAAARS